MARQLVVEIIGDASKFGSTVDQATTKATTLGGKLSGLGKGVALGAGIAAFNLMGAAIGTAIGKLDEAHQAFLDDEVSSTKLANALKNNIPNWDGNAAGAEAYATAQANDNAIDFGQYPVITGWPYSILVVTDSKNEASRSWVFSLRKYTGLVPMITLGLNAARDGSGSIVSAGTLYLYSVDSAGEFSSPTTGSAANAVQDGVHHYGVTVEESGAVTYYVDGKIHSTNTQIRLGSTFDAAQVLRIGGVATTTNNSQNPRSQIITRAWNGRLLTEADFRALYDNPFGLYVQKQKMLWMGAGGGASQTVSPGAGHLALSGQQPTVTQSGPIIVSPSTWHLICTGHQPTVSQIFGGDIPNTPEDTWDRALSDVFDPFYGVFGEDAVVAGAPVVGLFSARSQDSFGLVQATGATLRMSAKHAAAVGDVVTVGSRTYQIAGIHDRDGSGTEKTLDLK